MRIQARSPGWLKGVEPSFKRRLKDGVQNPIEQFIQALVEHTH
ncbi:MAG: hypothetical protein R3194_10395 [Limnobacter sp.]|nr:hypothetical protein [Limnobacter sp.]